MDIDTAGMAHGQAQARQQFMDKRAKEWAHAKQLAADPEKEAETDLYEASRLELQKQQYRTQQMRKRGPAQQLGHHGMRTPRPRKKRPRIVQVSTALDGCTWASQPQGGLVWELQDPAPLAPLNAPKSRLMDALSQFMSETTDREDQLPMERMAAKQMAPLPGTLHVGPQILQI